MKPNTIFMGNLLDVACSNYYCWHNGVHQNRCSNELFVFREVVMLSILAVTMPCSPPLP